MSSLSFEVKRKFFHVAMLFYLIIYIASYKILHSKIISVLILSIILVIFLIWEHLRISGKLKVPFFDSLWRKEEKKSLGGEVYYMLGVIIVLIFFNLVIATVSIFMLAFGDTVAALVGIKYGKTKLKSPKKVTLEGSIIELITNIFVGQIILGNLILSVPMAIAATLSETYISKIDDNLSIPIVASLVGTIINFIL